MSEHIYKMGDRVRHIDGREGMVERSNGPRITVQFPHHWRSSVVLASNLSPIEDAAGKE